MRCLLAGRPQTRLDLGSGGGLSHQLDGTRAGFINNDFDLMCMHKFAGEPLARGALAGRVSSVQSNYHIPISNTAAGLPVLENRCGSSPSNIGVSN